MFLAAPSDAALQLLNTQARLTIAGHVCVVEEETAAFKVVVIVWQIIIGFCMLLLERACACGENRGRRRRKQPR